MAVITMVSARETSRVRKFTWEAMGNADTGTAAQTVGLADKTVTITGTHGGSTIVIEGSNDGTNYFTLNDQSDNALSFASTAGTISLIAENPLYIRPKTTGGTGTDLDVILVAKGGD